MKPLHIDIVPFHESHQQEVDVLLRSIADEFEESIFSSSYPQATLPLYKYWVACHNGKVVGTIAFSLLQNRSIALKKMFLHKDYRGQGVSKALLDTLLDSASSSNISTIFLGTMTQFQVAQKFYEKQGFIKIEREDLPSDFPANPVDTLFYKKEIKFN